MKDILKNLDRAWQSLMADRYDLEGELNSFLKQSPGIDEFIEAKFDGQPTSVKGMMEEYLQLANLCFTPLIVLRGCDYIGFSNTWKFYKTLDMLKDVYKRSKSEGEMASIEMLVT